MVNTFSPVAIPDSVIEFGAAENNPLLLAIGGLRNTEGEIGATVTWNGETYPCTGGPEDDGSRIDEGGFRLESKVIIAIRCELFNVGPFSSGEDPLPMPQEKQTVSYKRSFSSTPKTYRIDAITNYGDAFLELNCNDPSQGA